MYIHIKPTQINTKDDGDRQHKGGAATLAPVGRYKLLQLCPERTHRRVEPKHRVHATSGLRVACHPMSSDPERRKNLERAIPRCGLHIYTWTFKGWSMESHK